MKKTHNGSTPGRKYSPDLEKMVLEEEMRRERKKQHHGYALLLIPVIMVMMVFGGAIRTLGCEDVMSSMEQFQTEQDALVEHLFVEDGAARGSIFKLNIPFRKGATTTSDFHLVDVNSLSESRTESDESWKLNDHLQLLNRAAETEVAENAENAAGEDVNIPLDLKEMMLISPITILLDDESDDVQKTKFLEILFQTLSINPEPKIVNLSKHPHYHQIMTYLQNYAHHEYTPVEASSEDEDDADWRHVDIPRLFVGGIPMGRFNDIISKYNDHELITYLKENGKGLISIN